MTLRLFPYLVQSPSCVQLFATPWTAAHQASLSLAISKSLPKFMFIGPLMQYRHPIFCHHLLLPPSFPSIRDFSNESALPIRWPKCWSFSFSPSNEYSGLLSFKIDSFDLLTIQQTLGSLLQHHSVKASILWCSASFRVQLSQWDVTTGKNIALTIWTFVGRVISLLFNAQSRFVIAFLPRSHYLLIPSTQCSNLTVASWPTYRFLGRQVRWSGIPISWRAFHSLLYITYTIKGFSVVDGTVVEVFLEFPCFLYHPANIDNFWFLCLF